ncbi:MAG: toxin-antitoxin system YwqK family antitoxin [Bacteroidales bacterium]|nr:toxin-antitoxin system YwqK family antitoxin [Bacteroidales bacterium]
MKKILCIICMFSFVAVNAQDSLINYRDINEKRQGYWLKLDKNGVRQYEGYFKNDVPIGEFKQYHPNGKIKYKMLYDSSDQKLVYVSMFDEVGELAAKGKYYDKIKDGVWTYYGANDVVILEETYKNGTLHGTSIVYWQSSNHNPTEIKNWDNGVKHGPWFWYYDGGKIRMQANYKQGKLDGDFVVYFVEGGVHVQGKYIDDKRDGVWNYYDENGERTISLAYNMGKPVQTEESAKQETEYVNTISLKEDEEQDDPEKFLDDPEALIYKDMGILEPEQIEDIPTKKRKKKRRKKTDILLK